LTKTKGFQFNSLSTDTIASVAIPTHINALLVKATVCVPIPNNKVIPNKHQTKRAELQRSQKWVKTPKRIRIGLD
jgi:hypothetical protein